MDPMTPVTPQSSGSCRRGSRRFQDRRSAAWARTTGFPARRMLEVGIGLWMSLTMIAVAGAEGNSTDKTLVSWVALANATQRGGSVLTLQRGDQFDGIVFGERAEGRWMAGSEFYRRTPAGQAASAVERAGPDTLVQVAIVYQGDRITLIRDGAPYSSHEARNIDLLSGRESLAVFGLRHVGAGAGQHFRGEIEDARIYDRALTVEEIRALRPNEKSGIKPYAWWTFEPGRETDRAGRFPFHGLSGGAKIAGGRLILPTDHAALIAAMRKSAATVLTESDTPSMPARPPSSWLTYHLAHPGPSGAIPADPNPVFYHKGRYHLHYIYNHRDGCAFAHVSSTDMVHWRWHPTTLTRRQTGHGMFSGTGFFTREGQPAMIYHGEGSGRNQIAFALDDMLETWSKPVPIEPLTASGEKPDMNHWDPDCWIRDGTYYALSGGSHPKLLKSQDLKSWLYLGELYHEDFPANLGVSKAEDTSCANLFRLGDKWMLLCISHALGARYYLGDFKGEKFLPDFHAMLNWARWDFFAPESVLTPDGRRVMWAWCTPWVNDMQKVGRKRNFDTLLKKDVFQQGIQSLPREISLPADGVLRIKPLRELEQLRASPRREKAFVVPSDTVRVLDDIQGDVLELEVVVSAPQAREFGINLLCDDSGANGFTVATGAGSRTLNVGYSEPPFELRAGEDLTLRIFIDKSMIEVFANDRQAAVAWHEASPGHRRVSLFSRGGDLHVQRVTAWKMRSIYDGRSVLRRR